MELSQIPKQGQWSDIADVTNDNFNKVNMAVVEGVEQSTKAAAYASGYANEASQNLAKIQEQIEQMETLPSTDPALVAKVANNTTDIKNTKAAVNSIKASTTAILKDECPFVGYLAFAKNGEMQADSNWRTSDYIELDGVTQEIEVKLSQASAAVCVVFYNASKSVISINNSYTNGAITTLSVPSEAVYVRASMQKNADGQYVKVNFAAIAKNCNIIVKDSFNTFDKNSENNIEYGYIKSDGTFAVDNSKTWITTDYIHVHVVKDLHLYVYNKGAHVAAISFYDKEKKFIGYIGETHATYVNFDDYVIPENAYLCRFSYDITHGNSVTIYELKDDILNANDKTDNNKKEIDEINASLFKKYDIEDCIYNGYLEYSQNGVLRADGNWLTSDYINVSNRQTIKINLAQVSALVCVVFYDKNKYVISCFNEYGNLIGTSVVVPNNAMYVRVSMQKGKDGQYLDATILNQESALKQIIPYIEECKVYTVCNDIKSSEGNSLNSRNYTANIYIDHFFKGLTDYPDMHVQGAKNTVPFTSRYEIAYATKYINSETNGETKDVNIKDNKIKIGGNVKPIELNIKHISTRNKATASKKVRLLCIGDSVTAGCNAEVNRPYDTAPKQYWQWVDALFNLDKLENGGGYDCVTLGNFLYKPIDRYGQSWEKLTHDSYDVNFDGLVKNGVMSCAMGYAGSKAQDWLNQFNGRVNPLYDTSENKFSLRYFVEKYRTLIVNADGTTTRCNNSNKGELVTDVNDYNVCEPTHVLLAFGYNQPYYENNQQRIDFLSALNTIITTIRTEYPNVYILLQMPDTAGTYFPQNYVEYIQDSNAVYSLDYTRGQAKNWHDMLTYMTKDLMQLENTDNKVFYVPSFFVSPLVMGGGHRIANDIINMSDASLGKQYIHGGTNAAHLHPNNAAHAAWGYQIYSLIKYTLTL